MGYASTANFGVVELIGGIVYGDANGDGIVNSIDATLVTRYSLSAATLSNEALICCDVNGDETVNSIDAAIITRYVLKVVSKIPV